MAKFKLNIKNQTVAELIASAQQTYDAINANATVGAPGTPMTELNNATTDLVTKNNTYAATLQLAREQLTERDEQRRIVEDLLYWSTLPAPTSNGSLENVDGRAYVITPLLAEILSQRAAIPHGGLND